tara:strand:- start:36220 stop:36642 length:423 start_codon:yes stop_codon:yes gene_type:complete
MSKYKIFEKEKFIVIGFIILLVLFMCGVKFMHGKHMEKVEARPNYEVSQSIKSVDGKMELTTKLFFYPNAKKDVMFSVGEMIYINKVDIPSANALVKIKEFEYNKTEPFESTHREMNNNKNSNKLRVVIEIDVPLMNLSR